MSPTLFRCLVISSVLLALGGAVVDVWLPDTLSPLLSKAYEDEPLPGVLDDVLLASLLLIPWSLASLISTVGLLFFKRWARALFLYSTAIGFALYPFLGPHLSSSWSQLLSDASYVVIGAVLALAYYSPLRERFARRSGNDRSLIS